VAKLAHFLIDFLLFIALISQSACVTAPPLVIEKNKVKTPHWATREPGELFQTKGAVRYLSVQSIRDNLPSALKQAADDAVEKANSIAKDPESMQLLNEVYGKSSAGNQLVVELHDLYYEKVKAAKSTKDQLPYYYKIYILLELTR
jgi:hypothetical protein